MNKVYDCEFEEIKVGEHPFGYEFYLKIEGEWMCDLRLFVNKENQVRYLTPLINDTSCKLDDGSRDIDEIITDENIILNGFEDVFSDKESVFSDFEHKNERTNPQDSKAPNMDIIRENEEEHSFEDDFDKI